MTNSTISVGLVDDHELVRVGLKAALEVEEDIRVVCEASDGSLAVDMYRSNRPDVVLMDVRMEKMDGIEACRRLKSEDPDARVLMLTTYSDEDAVFAAIMAGASGYLLKDISRNELVQGVRSAAVGKSLLDPNVTLKVLDRMRSLQGGSGQSEVLSKRELQVLSNIVDGKTNREIAEHLVIAENTVIRHVHNIYTKLDVSSRVQATTYAIRHRLVE